MSTHRIKIGGRFDPARSVLGRRFARADGPLRGEARYYLWAVMIFLIVLVANFVSWAALTPVLEAGEPTATVAVLFRIAQPLSVLLFVSLCVIGFRRPIHLLITEPELVVTQGDRREQVRKSAITSIEIVAATAWHRHYRRYRRVISFAGARAHEHVVIRAGERIITIGIDGDVARRLVDFVRTPATLPASQNVRLAL